MKAWIEKGWLFLLSKKKFSSRLPLEFICSSGSSYLMAFELEHQFFLDLVHAVTHSRYGLASPCNRVEPIPYYLLLSLCNTHPVPFSGEPWLITVINYVNRQTKKWHGVCNIFTSKMHKNSSVNVGGEKWKYTITQFLICEV